MIESAPHDDLPDTIDDLVGLGVVRLHGLWRLGGVATVSARPQRGPIRPIRLIVKKAIATRFVIHDIRVGSRSQLAQPDELPGSLFMDGADVPFEPAQAGMDISIDVEYVGPELAGEVFDATILYEDQDVGQQQLLDAWHQIVGAARTGSEGRVRQELLPLTSGFPLRPRGVAIFVEDHLFRVTRRDVTHVCGQPPPAEGNLVATPIVVGLRRHRRPHSALPIVTGVDDAQGRFVLQIEGDAAHFDPTGFEISDEWLAENPA